METTMIRHVARKSLDLLMERAVDLRLELLRVVQALETATEEEQPVLAQGEQDVVCLIVAIRSAMREFDEKEVF